MENIFDQIIENVGTKVNQVYKTAYNLGVDNAISVVTTKLKQFDIDLTQEMADELVIELNKLKGQ